MSETTLKQLEALVEIPGALRVITNEHACGGGKHPSDPGFNHEACAAFEADLSKPEHFVIHDVVSIEGPDHKGRYTAFTDEGDWCMGQPEALLKRLTEVR